MSTLQFNVTYEYTKHGTEFSVIKKNGQAKVPLIKGLSKDEAEDLFFQLRTALNDQEYNEDSSLIEQPLSEEVQ